jgi:hypothetical protein
MNEFGGPHSHSLVGPLQINRESRAYDFTSISTKDLSGSYLHVYKHVYKNRFYACLDLCVYKSRDSMHVEVFKF